MAYFTEGLITEILSRLPVKPLMRFKCVSKSWNSLISDPKFATLQLKGAKRAGSRLLLTTEPPQSIDYGASSSHNNTNNDVIRTLSYPRSDFMTIWVQGSCNGLIAFAGCSVDRHPGEFLWNPTTGDYKKLPDVPRLQAPVYWPTFSGVGYNVSCDDYGVLHGFTKTQRTTGIRETTLHLYTLKTGKWRQLQNAAPEFVPYLEGRAISWNDDMFWLCCKPNGVRCLASFDLKEEKFKEIQLPLPGDHGYGLINLGMSGNSLCVFYKGEENCFEGWALKVDGNGASSWNRFFSFLLETFGILLDRSGDLRDTLLCLTKEGEILMDCEGIITGPIEFKTYLYNLKDRKIKYLEVNNYISRCSKLEFYIESLVSPNN